MDMKEKVKNDVLMGMRYHIDSGSMDILNGVLVRVLSGVEIMEMETLPATLEDTNQYIIDLFRMQKAPKLSGKTVAFYLDTIQRLTDTVHKSLLRMTRMDIERYLMQLTRSNTAVSLNNQRRNISAFFTWMRKNHLIMENPCESVESYRQTEKPIDHMEPEEFEQLKNGCRHKRDRALIEFLRSTAMRVGEVEYIKVSDIDWRTGQINIYGEKTRCFRVVCLDSVALKYLSEYVESRKISYTSREPLFVSTKRQQASKPLKAEAIRSSLKAIRERAGLERRIYPHLFRKTTATNIVKRGGSIHDAGEYLGHKDRSTAGRFYAYVDQAHTLEIFRKYVAAV